MTVDRQTVEAFLFREARLMDTHQYDEWLSLWEDDALYWVPCNEDEIDPMRHVSLIYDDHARLEDRIDRLNSATIHSQDPRSRMSRVISNVEVEEDETGSLTVYSNFNLTELRRGRQNTFAGRSVHVLRPANGGFRMAQKKVLLVNNDDVINNLTFLV